MAPSTVWTNVEDEILKASISKYGMNQWARVSSLLARKSAKQCKARWQEYLDPGIRKTEWSKDEDERLLHLVKIFSTQWRTISTSLQGRSANQCLQRYQQILDEAEKRESDEFGLAGVTTGEAAPTADDVRKLRPGEVDPDPETKPAKPDAVDMDEEEKEMLSEARARLANTQGKKAKRKARERLLEESRRTAQLQKRRELKMSGINIKIRTAKKGEMDYNADVPFEHNVPRGFYDVDEERERNDQEKAAFDPKKQQLANKRKGDQGDEGEDRKRKKTDKNAGAGQSISAQAMKAAQLQKIREAERSSKRRALALPAPQVNEGELEEVIKMGMAGERASRGAITGENEATRGLVGNYNNLVSGTPIRTPRAAPEEDRIANELRNIRAMQGNQSALLGEETEDLIEGSGSTGFAGIQPSKQQLVTPNPMATPFRQANGVGATPGRGPGATPMRDTFNLNAQNGLVPVGQTPREVRQYEQNKRSSILAKLAALPGPKKISLELELPEEQEAMQQQLSNSAEDASVRDAREKRIRDAAELAQFKRQTYVVQQRLPRPALVNADALMQQAEAITDPIEREVAIEAALLITNDAAKFGGSKIIGSTKPIQIFDDELMKRAREAVAQEMASEDAQKEKAAFRSAWSELHATVKLPGLDGYYEDEIDEHQMMVEQFDNIEDKITSLAERGNELEKTLAKLHGGYQNRAKMLREKIGEAAEALEKTTISLNTALSAQISEDAAIPRRLEVLRDEVSFVSRREREAQEEYRKVKDELDSLAATNGYH